MNIFQIIILIFIVSGMCFLMFQLWYYYENYEYILEFNKTYKRLEYSTSPNISYVDKSIKDPNDDKITTEEKFRCVLTEGTWYGLFKDGFISDSSSSLSEGFNNKIDCIDFIFKTRIPIIYSPCVVEDGSDCRLLRELMEESELLKTDS